MSRKVNAARYHSNPKGQNLSLLSLYGTPANQTPKAGFIVRIEMQDATWDDYEALHAAMADHGFLKFIQSDDGRVFNLPDAEYHGTTSASCERLRDFIQIVANGVKPGAMVLVTEAGDIAWTLRLAG